MDRDELLSILEKLTAYYKQSGETIENQRQHLAELEEERVRLRKSIEVLAEQARVDLSTLIGGESPGNIRDDMMNHDQLQRRGRAIARARAGGTKDPRRRAIIESEWGSVSKYADKRLGMPNSTVADYLNDLRPVPMAVAKRFEEDFGLPADETTWKMGVVS